MSEPRINTLSTRAASAVQRVGTATDRRQKRQGDDKRKDGETPHKRRRLYDLLFEEIDHVPELAIHQRERLKNNIRAHLALRARDQTPLPTTLPPQPDAQTAPQPQSGGPKAKADQPEELDHDRLIGIVAPTHEDLPPEELEQNAQLAAQFRDCLARNTEIARKVAAYLRILLSIDGALDPHIVIDI